MKNNALMTLFPLQLYFTILPIVGRLAMPVTGCVNPIPFEGLTGFSRGPIRTKNVCKCIWKYNVLKVVRNTFVGMARNFYFTMFDILINFIP